MPPRPLEYLICFFDAYGSSEIVMESASKQNALNIVTERNKETLDDECFVAYEKVK